MPAPLSLNYIHEYQRCLSGLQVSVGSCRALPKPTEFFRPQSQESGELYQTSFKPRI